MSTGLAPDDVVRTHDDAAAHQRPPLLVLEPLAAFLDEHGLGHGDLDAVPIGEGHSNVTYLVRRAGAEVVVRRPPRPPLPPSAHDVLREARVLCALEPTPVRAPAASTRPILDPPSAFTPVPFPSPSLESTVARFALAIAMACVFG